ncbi:glycosyltransferase family 4 protein [Vagococcus fluvialis]|uniref:glycosyltransferase family 4 protein n=1 Tax=Vagococcus fluvialis TaxID=2738 RepID=UPI001A8CC0AC|nr:glycosyltransferase family 4 protein [Vagococcus fluvialis]MBO0487290.1 glycosyltransferase family 4 protein [Vagococcus fluvialis]MDT2781806.1 glycosyltransferase family 4 protein [Vagococcus fluvialis]WNF90889.1 glycosyltransferase family 4 protein [Vagococcus fluvialis]
MKIGFFTDTYFPQVSGVSTSIRTLKEELEALGHEVYIFTTTDPNVRELENRIIRMPSVPFISFKERRVIIRGMLYAYYVAKDLELDIIHTHTEFGLGMLGKQVAKALGIPCVHTYHTMYEDYLHYIANGKLIRPVHVKQFSKLYTAHMSGIICPSQRVVDKLEEYEIEIPKYIVPTGIDVSKFKPVPKDATDKIKADYDITDEHIFLLSVSRISYEKNIQTILAGMPEVIAAFPNVRLLIVGDGPYKKDLEEQATELEINGNVIFAGEIPNEEISPVYQAADIFVSASDSETQGLTYTEAMAAKTRVVAKGNAYLDPLFDSLSLGVTYKENEDFAKSLIAYINGDYSEDDEILKNKLYEISSEAFGKTVSALYEKIISDYEYSETEIEDEDEGLSSLRIFRK